MKKTGLLRASLLFRNSVGHVKPFSETYVMNQRTVTKKNIMNQRESIRNNKENIKAKMY